MSGFNIHNGVKIDRQENKVREALAQYIIRSSFSQEKIQYIYDSGTVIYRSKMGHGKNKRNFEIFNAEEFIARITQHIPRGILSIGTLLRLVFESIKMGSQEAATEQERPHL